MLETLYSLDFPAGLQNNGTTYQSKGRWHLGNGIRFFNGTIQPVGGWASRSFTGATITGIPNAMLSWESVDQHQFIVIGTTTGLWVISQLSSVVYSIMPVVVTSQTTPYQWDLTTFGTFLIAVLRTTASLAIPAGTLGGESTTVYRWEGAVTSIAVPNHTTTTGPISTYGAVVTPERFLVLLRGGDPGDYDRDTIWTD